MDTQRYKAQLLGLQKDLSGRANRAIERGRDQITGESGDIGDASVADEAASEDFTQAERDSVTLQEVEAALQRIEDGTYGTCVVDGGPIEPQRLDAVPWTDHCLKHQALLEAAAGVKTPSL